MSQPVFLVLGFKRVIKLMVVWYHLLFIFIYFGFEVKMKGEKQLQRIEKSGSGKRVACINVTSRDCQRKRTLRYLSF